MPALRKGGRPPRSSTTPYASPTGTPSDSKERNQRSIMEWAEPSIQNPTPSFEEHGFARHGVLEQMAPLGQPPSAKVKQRTRAMGGDAAARKSLAGKGSFLGEEVGSTPEVTPAPELEPDDSERQEEEDLPLELLPQEEDEDDDYVPGKTKKKIPTSKANVRGKQSAQAKTPGEAKTPIKGGTSRATSTPASPAVQPVEESRDSETSQRAQIALLAAAESANAHRNPQLAEAFKQMRAASKSDPNMAFLIEAIIKQNQTPEQWASFRGEVKALKKAVKKQKRRYQRSADVSATKADISKISQQPSPRPSSEVAPEDSASFTHEHDAAMEDVYEGVDSTAGALPSPHPLSTAPALPAVEPSVETVPRQPSKSPRKKHVSNGHLAPSSEMDVDGGASSPAPTPARGTPDAGEGSDSELSEVNEEIVQKGPPTPAQPKEKNSAPPPAAAVKRGKGSGGGRGGKKHANKGKLFGKHAHKNLPQSTERLEDMEEIDRLRGEMADAQPLRQFDLPFPQSEVRFDDEILETESLTESMIAVGPPVDSDQPRRAGRMPQGAKRLHEDMSRFSSPQLESAAVSRPTTPAVQPAIKRIKLNNGQAARTKRSPVKNRDGGPIAGVAFNGGGGSRQLGPDDNDPNSPASESEDQCAACKGAGEFVCCEGCPRVFHLLCMDPPRMQVPDGSFYCHACSAGPPEEADPEDFIGLKTLFASLDRTNPRAFALPQEVQNRFEDVSARSDGSYYEEVKKFPLAKSSGYGYQRPDYTKVFEGDKPILCVQCGLSSGNKRQMLKCDFCSAHWHLDCVDPPLANPPHISLEASQRDAWRCPRHIEHDLRSGMVLQNDLNEELDDVEMGDDMFSRVPRKIRKRKNPDIVEPTFSRGMRNNGLIDIINDPEDDTDGEGNYTGFEFKDVNSKVYRVPERGLIADFLTKVKSSRKSTRKCVAQDNAHVATQRKASMQNFVTHSFQQQQAALNLALLANREQDIGLSEGTIDSLVLTLTAEAPQEVVTAMTNSAPPPVAADERAQLLKLQELIQRRLNAS